MIDKTIQIDELVERYPAAVKYLMDRGIKCVVCGEPIWGSLEEVCLAKGFGQADIQQFVSELRQLAFE